MEKLLATVKADASSFWKKLVQIWNGDIKPVLSATEAEVFSLLKPLLGQFEADELQVAITFVKGVVAAAPYAKSIADWETVVIQLAEVAGGQTWTVVKGLAGNGLKALISLVLEDLALATAALAATKAAKAPVQEAA